MDLRNRPNRTIAAAGEVAFAGTGDWKARKAMESGIAIVEPRLERLPERKRIRKNSGIAR